MSTLTQAQSAILDSKLAVVSRSIDTLQLNARNPRLHKKRQIKQLAASITAFGFNVPVLVTADGTVVAGHARVLACRELGWTTVPTICLDHLSPDQAKAFAIADNRLSEIATWDDRLLGEALQELSLLNLDFSLDATGFDFGEIDFRIEGLSIATDATVADAADALPPSTGPAVSIPGDLWLLGPHRVLCADATQQASYAALMNGEQAAGVFTDPPYNVPIAGHVSGLGRIQHREFAMGVGEMSRSEFVSFLAAVCARLVANSRDGSVHYVCMDWKHSAELMEAGAAHYSELKNICVWAKGNAGMGSFYRSGHEFVLVFKNGTAPHRNNVELGKHGRNRTNVWSYPGVNAFGRAGEEGNLLALHPTVKPVRLVADAILDSTVRGEVVLDAFLGSGTTLMAAERTRRRCFGLELDPLYVDTIVRRWQAYTGDTARHAVTQQSFAETAAARAAGGGGVP